MIKDNFFFLGQPRNLPPKALRALHGDPNLGVLTMPTTTSTGQTRVFALTSWAILTGYTWSNIMQSHVCVHAHISNYEID